MSKIVSKENYSSFISNNAFEWSCYLLVFGLFYSRALLSISTVLILLSSLISFYQNKNKEIKIGLIQYLFLAIYVAFILSIFNTKDINEWKSIVFKVNYLILLPFGFLLAPKLNQVKIKYLLAFFILCCFVCLTIDSIYVLLNYEHFIKQVEVSKNIVSVIGPVHTELGLLSTVSFVLIIYFISIEKKQLKLLFLTALSIIFFLELCVISFRFSLLSIFILGVLYLIYQTFILKKYIKLVYLVLISLSAVFLVKTVPPVKARYENTVKDIYSIIENKNPNFQSLGQRWAAIKCTTEIIKRNIWFGVSPSDLKDEMQTQYQKDSYLLIPENRIFIHNQFLYYAASFGIPFTVIIFIVFLILIIKETKKNQLIFWLMVPFFLHMFSDNTLERQISGGCILFFLLLLPNLNMKSQP